MGLAFPFLLENLSFSCVKLTKIVNNILAHTPFSEESSFLQCGFAIVEDIATQASAWCTVKHHKTLNVVTTHMYIVAHAYMQNYYLLINENALKYIQL